MKYAEPVPKYRETLDYKVVSCIPKKVLEN